jgi:putative ABC transport system permease protein
MNRATEVAVRKIVGCGKSKMFFSFLFESLLLSFISLLIAIVIVIFVLDTALFQELTGINLTADFIHNPVLLMGSIGITLAIGVAAGIYPAFYLPAIPVIAAIKGKYKNSQSGHRFRRALISIQFVISIFVITCTLYMRDQIDFLLNKDLGFSKQNILVLPVYDASVRKNLLPLKNALLQNPGIAAVTASQSTMGMGIGGNVMFGETDTGMQEQGGILALFVDDDYLKTMGISLIAGRNFQSGEGVDEDGVYIANEAAVKLMGWGNNALGKKVTFWGGANPGTVVGVVKDFNSSSLHHEVAPMFIVKGHWDTGLLQIRLAGENIAQTIAYVKDQWSRYDNSRPFEYFFLDHRFNEQYKEDISQNKLLNALSYVCIFISLLGLLGLSAFTTAQRTKEIGLRKILGARIAHIVFMLSKDVLGLVIISSIIVLPVCWWVVTAWLQNFAYRGDLNYLLYFVITLLAIGFVFFVILLQSLKIARSNPIDSLKCE